MIKIDELKEPPIVGEIYLVPCIVSDVYEKIHNIDWDSQEMWLDDKDMSKIAYKNRKMVDITPVINYPHTDRENGQNYFHYHVDTRWQVPDFYKSSKVNKEGISIRMSTMNNISFIPMICNNNTYGYKTDVRLINKSKLKHDCIYKGKCPHRGMDLSQVTPDENGIITCPLHSLKFDSRTKKIINENR